MQNDFQRNLLDTKNWRWINPFITKLSNHQDIIFSGIRGQEQDLCSRLQPVLSQHNKIFLELCSGSGQHCLQLALQNPEVLVIGVELRFKRIVRTAEKGKQLGIKNMLLLQTDANCLPSILSACSIDRIYTNFPDPWENKRHWNNRFLLSKEFLARLTTLLKPGGELAIKTDHQERYGEVCCSIKELSEDLEICATSLDLHSSEFKNQNILTEFESLFASQKKPVFYIKARKLSNSATLMPIL